jgi:two-component system sensor histidine kinase ArlS
MTLKKRIALFISLLFTLLFGVVCFIIVSMFSDFRQEEFKERLEEKALSTIKLLTEVKEVDNQLLKIIDQNSINKLYNEKTLVFDGNYHLIYSSLDDTKISWTKSDLDFLKLHKTFFKKEGDNEIYGVFHDTKNMDYYALISANDSSGKRKQEYLMYLTIAAYILFTLLAWLLTFYTIKKLLMPLDRLHSNISQINEYSLATRIQANEKSENEIDLIGIEFNLMMNRIEDAYQKQKDFTAHASHELRTPLARISALVENELNTEEYKNKNFLYSVFHNVKQITDLIHSLLILSKVEARNSSIMEVARIDEAIYNSIEKIHAEFKNFKVNFEIVNSENIEELLQVNSNQGLLEIVFFNLLSNAYQYSDNAQAAVQVKQCNDQLQVIISNTGPTLSAEEQKKLFQPFSRGSNSKNKPGLGLGLRIAHRILSVYNYEIRYRAGLGLNEFLIFFK